MRAAGYVRVSTEEQAREGYGLSAQEQAVKAYCQAQGWELVEVYADAGRSGSSTKGRDELARMLVDAQGDRFERVVFWKLDRLARNLSDLLDITNRLETCAVEIVSIHEAIDTGTAAGRMMRSVLGAMAEFERDVITDRIKAGVAEKARQGELVGPLPLGYRRDESGSVVLDTVTAPLIREAYVRYATGDYSLRDMTSWAAGVGLRSVHGNPLDRLSIRKILGNVTYAGQVAYHLRKGGGVVAKGKHKAIVDAALFTAVQEALVRRRRNVPSRPYGKEPYPLSGTAICGFDAAPLLGVKATSAGQPYMRCSTAQRRGKEACRQPMVRAHILEDQVASYIGGMRLPPEYLGEVVAELRRRRKDTGPDPGLAERLRREIDRWHRLFVLGEVDEQRLKRETAPLKRTLAEIERPQEVLDVERAVNYLRDVGSLWAESPRGVQREYVREVFNRIVVRGPQVESITPKGTYEALFVLDRRERFNGEMGVIWLPGQESNLQPSG